MVSKTILVPTEIKHSAHDLIECAPVCAGLETHTNILWELTGKCEFFDCELNRSESGPFSRCQPCLDAKEVTEDETP
jgi:hypothetical protein